jgi:hypothetical protein
MIAGGTSRCRLPLVSLSRVGAPQRGPSVTGEGAGTPQMRRPCTFCGVGEGHGARGVSSELPEADA